jgi:hypothetical protein
MNGSVPLFPQYTSIVWTGKTLALLNALHNKEHHSSCLSPNIINRKMAHVTCHLRKSLWSERLKGLCNIEMLLKIPKIIFGEIKCGVDWFVVAHKRA